MSYDFSTAEKPQGDMIPEKTVALLSFQVLAGDEHTKENAFVVTKTGLYQLVLEATVVEGDYARRKVWHRLTMGAQEGVEMTDGQKKGVSISGSFLRSLLEAARNIAPTDESPKAIAARKVDSIFELNGMEAWCEIGIEKGTGTFSDKNRINKVINALAAPAGGAKPAPARPAAASPAATFAAGGSPAKPAAPAARPAASWAS